MKREGEGIMLQIKKDLKETNVMCYPAWILSPKQTNFKITSLRQWKTLASK